MGKIKTLSELSQICEKLKRESKTVGLVTGCFDIFHLGHIELFRFAKKQVDVLAVGVENDKSIRLSKRKGRPVFSLPERLQVIAKPESVDYVFPIEWIAKFDTNEAEVVYDKIIKKIEPSKLITNALADKYWRRKKYRAEKFGVEFITEKRKRRSSSSKIIQKLETEM